MNLVEFLLARIAEDEEAARGATPGPWDADRYWFDGDGAARAAVGNVQVDVIPDPPGVRYEDAAHIAMHDPARVLAECEAKRRIVKLWQAATAEADELGDPFDRGDEYGLEQAAHLLALPYAGHPDYDEDWRP